MKPLRLAVIADFREEGWPSMDVCAEMLARHAAHGDAGGMEAVAVCPPFRRRAVRAPVWGSGRFAFNADRLLNRWWDYPRFLRDRRGQFSLFHICDHSYAHLAHQLPAERTGVYCHDLDAFRCVLDSPADHRPLWFRAMMRRVLGGLKKAAVVFCSTMRTRDAIVALGLVDPSRLVHAPYGTSPEFTPREDDGGRCDEADEGICSLQGRPYLLHVGSCIARKRIDVLLDVFAGVRNRHPDMLLVQAGGRWTADQRDQLVRLRLEEAVRQFRQLSRTALAALYRGASLVLQPSEAEGFGLPVIEALACDTPVVASDLAVLREVGGAAAVYCPVGDVEPWVETVARLLEDPRSVPPSPIRLAQARKFSWASHARVILDAYRKLVA